MTLCVLRKGANRLPAKTIRSVSNRVTSHKTQTLPNKRSALGSTGPPAVSMHWWIASEMERIPRRYRAQGGSVDVVLHSQEVEARHPPWEIPLKFMLFLANLGLDFLGLGKWHRVCTIRLNCELRLGSRLVGSWYAPCRQILHWLTFPEVHDADVIKPHQWTTGPRD